MAQLTRRRPGRGHDLTDQAQATHHETPLHDRHVALGARLIEFGGWLMPVQYSGILEEHRAVRERAGLFDLSHMGELFVEGPDAAPLRPRWSAIRRPSPSAGPITR